jgi:putative OPT family oligopeptide transporter
MILGALITCVFTAANIYLGLKVGLTFASSIPAAVISMVVLRLFGGASVLENNVVQTQASAAGTLSSIIFVVPGLVMVGHWHGFPWFETAGLCAAGGILGVMFTIPLRRAMIIDSALPFPEGVAAAEVLKVGDDAASGGARDLAIGGVIAGVFSLRSSGFGIFADAVSCVFTVGNAVFKLGTGLSIALVGAGYLMGIAAGVAIIVGFVISWGIAVPYLTATTPLPDGMDLAAFAQNLWKTQVRFMGAGTIGIAAVWTLATLVPSIVRGLKKAAGQSRGGRDAITGIERTDRDMSVRQIVVVTLLSMAGLLVVFLAFLGADSFGLALLATLWATALGFLVASACGYMAGIVGSSSSPISGVGIVAVVLTSLGLLAMPASATTIAIPVALFVTSAVVAAGTISNDNLQDLKTGYLVGATPASQQIALIVGCIVGAIVIPPLLDLLYQAYGFPGALPRVDMDPNLVLAAPQATLISTLATGILGHQINWTMIGIGLAIGTALIVVDLVLKGATTSLRLPVLAVGIGIYLPPAVAATLVVGAVLGWIIKRCLAKYPQASQAKADQRGVLIASGFIVGESLVGVVLAGIIAAVGKQDALILVGPAFAPTASALGLITFLAACVVFARMVIRKAANPNGSTV